MYSIKLGTDPELFLQNSSGSVVGSERVIPEEGLFHVSGWGSVIRDGVQVELNPYPSSCRQSLAYGIARNMEMLKTKLLEYDGKFTISMKPTVKVLKRELARLSEKSRQFGCEPSFNIYGMVPVDVDPATYRVRAAGGHIHLGGLHHSVWATKSLYPHFPEADHRMRLVAMLDVLVGNTCVLLDRDTGQKERRKYYGRAGEYRLPSHGLEYRTLSNFWLRNYVLMSFVMGMARLAHHYLVETCRMQSKAAYAEAFDYEKKLMSTIDFDVLQKAINENDVKLARINWEKVKTFLMNNPITDGPLHPSVMGNFLLFVEDVQKYGLEKVFPEDPFQHWTKGIMFEGIPGWERFIESYARNRSAILGVA